MGVKKRQGLEQKWNDQKSFPHEYQQQKLSHLIWDKGNI
jgi:hypothetical protein